MNLLPLIPALPLASSLILGLFGPALGERRAGFLGAASIFLAAALSITIALAWLAHPPPDHALTVPLWSWIALPGATINIALYLDPVSLLMILVITCVGFLIHLFSTAYMAGEDGYSRYFAYMNLFVAAMLLLVLADDLLVLFIGWEGVGVCSYLLVGFWFSPPENGYAARKSFVVTRIADIAMLIGLLLAAIDLGTLSIQPLLHAATTIWPPGSLAPSALAALLLIGGLGKSAQAPLHTWLPDAMAGPTPVSALIHAATMVTAGVYLVVRLHPLFQLAPAVLTVIGIGAAATLLIAAFTALAQTDIKRILAYSTMSQIGYMFLALGVGAWGAAMFHFLTHAIFKALLFLSAGAISMRLHHEQNIFAMGGLRKKLPVAFWCFLIGAAALAALPVISAGFFSKEFILAAVFAAPAPALAMAGLLGSFLTATYIFRAVFTVFLGPVRTDISGTAGLRIWAPLIILALAALTAGWLQTPGFLGGNQFLTTALGLPLHIPENLPLAAAGITAPLAGAALAYALHRNGFWVRHAYATTPLARTLRAGFFFDAFYDFTLTRPYLLAVHLLRHDPVDRLFTLLEHAAIAAHRRLRATQGGSLRRYAGWLMAGSVATIALLVLA
jgi:NADH-quinone oxidoreductase subunit L